MSVLDEQLKQSRLRDEEAFEASLTKIASVANGQKPDDARDDQYATRKALDEIMRYYHWKPVELPPGIVDIDDQLDYCLRPHGMMRRNVQLTPGWHKDCYGTLLAFWKETGEPVALLPQLSFGYYYYDRESNMKKKVTRKTAPLFQEDAICFYRPLPQKALGPGSLALFTYQSVSRTDNLFLVILTLLSVLVNMLLPVISKYMVGYVLETESLRAYIGGIVFLASTLVAAAVFRSVKNLAVTRLKTKISVPLEAAVMARLLHLPAHFFRQFSTGDLASRLQAMNSLSKFMVDYLYTVRLTFALSLLNILQIIFYAPKLTFAVLGVGGSISALSFLCIYLQSKAFQRLMENTAKTSEITFSLLRAIQKIKLAGAEKRAFSQWGNSYAEQIDSKYNIPLFLKLFPALLTAVTAIGTILFYVLAVQNDMIPSTYIAFHAAYGTMLSAFLAMANTAPSIGKVRTTQELLAPILKTVPETADYREMVTTLKGNIELSNVCFRYQENGPYVVDGMNLQVKAGEYVAIVGPSGCGKSTLMRLLLGFETPERGTIYYDRKDLSKIDLPSLRQKIGVVTQDSSLFTGDIYANIVLTAPRLSEEDAWRAAEIAGIAEDIRSMPMQMHTNVSEGQGGLSGGQKQRIMIARAIASRPRVLLFDEATSALDNKTQKMISDALDQMRCTRIVIAHRLSTIRHCDRILMMDQGKIVESGTYAELIARNGRFASFVAKQRLD